MGNLNHRSMIIVLMVSLTGCRGNNEGCSTEDHENVGGLWELTLVVESHCEYSEIGDTFTDFVTVEQDGSHIIIDIGGFLLVSELAGSICGDVISARASSSEQFEGCSGTERVSVTGTVDGDTAEGQIVFSQSVNDPEACFGITSCAGTYSFMGARVEP